MGMYLLEVPVIRERTEFLSYHLKHGGRRVELYIIIEGEHEFFCVVFWLWLNHTQLLVGVK